jgi:uncharacterized protein
LLWGRRYPFEAYTPPAKRQLGCYALPLLWCEQVTGWANMRNDGDRVVAEVGFAGARPRDAAFKRELEAELERIREFLGTAKLGRIVFRR